jgi:protein ImuA
MKSLPAGENSPQETVRALQQQLRRMEKRRPAADASSCTSGCKELDQLLPGGGLPRGGLVEWLSESSGSGAGTLAMIAAREAMREGGALIVMDRSRRFYPPAAAALGVDLEQVIVVRATNAKDELWALDQSLRCSAVAAVWAPLEKLDDCTFRRLQLAAETGGGTGMLLRPTRALGQPSWSDLQLLVEPKSRISNPKSEILNPKSAAWHLRIQITRCRGGPSGQSLEVEIDEVTGAVRKVSGDHETRSMHLAAQLAHPTARRRSARA